MPEGQGVGRRRKRAKPTSGATRHLLPEEGGRSGENYLLPSRGRGMPEGQGVGRGRKRVKPTSGATRHLLPEEGGKSGEKPSPPFPRKGDTRRAGGWAKAKERKANLRRCAPPPSRGRRESGEEPISLPVGGRSGKTYLPPSCGRGMPEGQGVGRRRKRAKPTSGATRHLLPEEGGRNGMSNPSTPFPWKGDARRAGGWPKAKESEANLRRYAPPPSRGRREKQ